jgi:hypothetical protein
MFQQHEALIIGIIGKTTPPTGRMSIGNLFILFYIECGFFLKIFLSAFLTIGGSMMAFAAPGKPFIFTD